LGGLWALEWAWHIAETNLRCVRSSGVCTQNLNRLAPIVSGQTDGQTDMARSTRLVILIKNIYTLWDRKRFLLPVTYFPTNLVYPLTLRVTGIKNEKVKKPLCPQRHLILFAAFSADFGKSAFFEDAAGKLVSVYFI